VSEAPRTEQPGRYQRSAGGMIGAMIILVLIIGAFVIFRSLTRAEVETRPDAVDYLETVGYAHDADLDVAYPEELPEDWLATRVDLGSAGNRAWGLTMLTQEGAFAGLRQDDEELSALLETYVDQDTTEREPVEVAGSVATRWQTFTDSGGDTAFAARAGPQDEWVLVYGSATPDQLLVLIDSLTFDR